MSYGILFLRFVLGLTVATHGAQKLFGSFGGHGPRGTRPPDASEKRPGPMAAIATAPAQRLRRKAA